MNKAPAFQFYPNDWLGDDNLQAATARTRGAWINLLAYMWGAKEQGKLSGTVDQICRLANVPEHEIDEILSEIKLLKIGTVTKCHKKSQNVTVINRRMYKRFKDKEGSKLRQRKHRVSQQGNKNVTIHPSDSSSDTSSDAMIQSSPTPPLILTAFIDKFHKHPEREDIERLINGCEEFIGFETVGRLLFAINSIKKPDKITNPIGWLIEFSRKPHDYLTDRQYDEYKGTR